MKKPTKKEVLSFVQKNYPNIFIEFENMKVRFEETKQENCWFKLYSEGVLIGQADYPLNDKFWDNVKKNLNWTWGVK